MLYYNDQFLDNAPEGFVELSRAVYYADSLFETIRVVNGRPLLWESHLLRLQQGMELLGMEWPDTWTSESLLQQIKKGFPGSVRLRWTVWRKPGGLYAPDKGNVGYSMTAVPLETVLFSWPSRPVTLGISARVRLPMDSFSGIKTLNAARYVQAARDAKLQGWDDAILLNAAERVCEATSTNIFWWEKGELRTVALEEGCVAGVFRAFLLEEAPRLGIPVKTTTLLPEQLTELEGLFLTNSIKGIVPASLTKEHHGEDQTRYLAEVVYQRLLNED